MKLNDIEQIEIGDYVIPKKDKHILVCTNVVKHQDPPEYFSDYVWCFEVFNEKDEYGAPFVFLLDKREMTYFKASLIKKNTKAGRNLEMLYGKV